MKHFKFINKLIILTLVVSSVFSTVAKADESEGSWKTDAVKVPSEGQLVGAGYILRASLQKTQTIHYTPL